MEIKSAVRNYKVQFFNGFGDALAEAAKLPNLFTVIDDNVYRLYRAEVENHLKGPVFPIVAVEDNKTYEKSGEYIRQLLEAGIRKNNQLLVIGGGIVQDIGGFMASILFRGIDYTLVPTTLLAQCDSCIGSKTSMNIAKYKNQLGTFYPPVQVLVSSAVLGTLSSQDLKSGICEALKLAMVEGRAATDEMARSLREGLTPTAMSAVVRQALEIKKIYIEEDEYDKGRRNLLNYGHTFGHAFESGSNYRIPHGVAVGIGMIAANFFSLEEGLISKDEFKEVCSLLEPWTRDFMPELHELKADGLISAMKSDKKSSGDKIGFILTRGYGRTERTFMPFEEAKKRLVDWLASV